MTSLLFSAPTDRAFVDNDGDGTYRLAYFVDLTGENNGGNHKGESSTHPVIMAGSAATAATTATTTVAAVESESRKDFLHDSDNSPFCSTTPTTPSSKYGSDGGGTGSSGSNNGGPKSPKRKFQEDLPRRPSKSKNSAMPLSETAAKNITPILKNKLLSDSERLKDGFVDCLRKDGAIVDELAIKAHWYSNITSRIARLSVTNPRGASLKTRTIRYKTVRAIENRI